jgi:hypothetical protein
MEQNMPIDKTINRIEAYGNEIDAHVEELAGFGRIQRTIGEPGVQISSADLLLMVVAHQVADAAARLKAVQVNARERMGEQVKAQNSHGKIADLDDYQE